MKLIRFLFNSSIFLTGRHIKIPYDLIHVHSVPDFEVFAAAFTKLKGAKIILDIHDIVPEFYASKFNQSKNSMLFKALALLERLFGEILRPCHHIEPPVGEDAPVPLCGKTQMHGRHQLPG